MAHLVYPSGFAAQLTLWNQILAWHLSLGSQSPLLPFLAAQGIDVTALQAAALVAKTQEEQRITLKKQSENSTQQRRKIMKLPWLHLRGELKFLKALYSGETKALGDWGVSISGTGKIAFPAKFTARARLVQAVLTKHGSYPAGSSPLQPYVTQKAIDVNADSAAVAAAMQKNADAVQQKNDSQLATQQRRKSWKPVQKVVRTIGALLASLYSENNRKMGDWGYEVVAAKVRWKNKKTKLKLGAQKRLNAVIIGSVFYNRGKTELAIWKGAKKKNEPVIVLPGEEFIIPKGYSIITIENLSSIETGICEMTVSK